MTNKRNGELFAAAVNKALAPEDAPRAEPDTPTGPRKPAPVPEVGAARAPRDHDAERRAMFADLMTNIINR